MDQEPHWGVTGGILTVAEIVEAYPHAVNRDLNFAGYHGDALIDLGDLVSIVIASPPTSAVRYAVEGGWSRTDHLVADWAEQQSESTESPFRYTRPGVEHDPDPGPVTGDGMPRFSVQTIDELKRRRERDKARAAELAATEREVVTHGGR